MSEAADIKTWDVVIIGGGPGGSTAGTLLAKQGLKVLVLEREQFPRFHVGESLLPYSNDIFKRLGFEPVIKKEKYIHKIGADFTSSDSIASIRFLFGDHNDEEHTLTYNVERSEFDHAMLKHAISAGCEVWYKSAVKQVSFDIDGVSIKLKRQRDDGDTAEYVKATWIIDASGLGRCLVKMLKLSKTELGLPKKLAVFAHFKGVYRRKSKAAGNVSIIRLDDGWIWCIPLDEERTSVGLVYDLAVFKKSKLTAEGMFAHCCEVYPEVKFRMKNAERVSDFYTETDYTARYREVAGERYFLVGDAAAFIDPVFSSGVLLAQQNACCAADMIIQAHSEKRCLRKSEQAAYKKQLYHAGDQFLAIVKMFYDKHAFEVFMSPNPNQQIFSAVIQLLAGRMHLPWRERLRIRIFYLLCLLQRHYPIAPRLRVLARKPVDAESM